ncbi:MAG: transglycosylase SLT domain-containing protein [Candidatus Promineifilaceae bacterium]|nr:transglycosylase SLT domain-containing protein [Candidatus Promineifilaceae bacterium]
MRIFRKAPLRVRLQAVTFLSLLLLAVLAGCAQAEEGEAPAVAVSTPGRGLTEPNLLPTPTLAAGAPTVVPLVAGPTATPTITPTPSPTPLPGERVSLGQRALVAENWDLAARHFQSALAQPTALSLAERESALWGLSRAYVHAGRNADAVDALNHFLAQVGPAPAAPTTEGPIGPNVGGPDEQGPVQHARDTRADDAYFLLGELYQEQGSCESAIAAYQSYLRANTEMGAYILPRIADCMLTLGDSAQAWTLYEQAAVSGAARLTEIELRQKLARYYLNAGDAAAAVAQYDAIHDLARTENTRGAMTYLAGQALLAAGDTAAAYARFRKGVFDYPRAYESYQGLVQLVDAGQAVDPFQRGLVDYYAAAYVPAVAAFEAAIAADPAGYPADTHLYLARTHAALGDVEAALAQLDAYAARGHAPAAALERGRLLLEVGNTEEALATYLELVEAYPEAEEAAEAAWTAAELAQALGQQEQALAYFGEFAERYPAYEDAPRILFRAGMERWRAGDSAGATALWRLAVSDFPQSEGAAASLIWLMTIHPEESEVVASATITATTVITGSDYYSLRAQEIAAGRDPFWPPEQLRLDADEAAERAEADAWLRDWLGLGPEMIIGELGPELASDPRLVRGGKLWDLGLYEMARRELEALRTDYAGDTLASYRLALHFRDLGLYRSSILAADNLLRLTGQTVFQTPRLIGRLAYPVYYADLIVPLADEYGFDPLLQFALVRQESLFESFISSSAGAQGLSQVMPATGADIASRLAWPGYENEDLYRPYVGLAFGAYYLDQQLDAFDGSVYAALSAYNGGPGNAIRWRAAAPTNPDHYLESVDFWETRQYIMRIYSGYAAYRHLYGR